MVLISAGIDIAIIATVLVVASRILQSKMIDKKKMKEQRKEMKEKQAQIKELLGKDDEKSRQDAQQLQMEIMKSMSESNVSRAIKASTLCFVHISLTLLQDNRAGKTLVPVPLSFSP